MVEGTAVLTTLIHAMRGLGIWADEAGTNLLDSGAHFYEVYETSDGGHIAVGAIEPQFYAALLLELLELDPGRVPADGPGALARVQGTLRRDCSGPRRGTSGPRSSNQPRRAAPRSSPWARRRLIPTTSRVRRLSRSTARCSPAPAPRFSRTKPEVRSAPSEPGADTDDALAAWGVDYAEIARLRDAGAFG